VIVSEPRLASMFARVSFTKDQLYTALRTMGPKAIKPAFRAGWSHELPTYCTCYFVAEMVYFYAAPQGTKPYAVHVPGDPGFHRFLKYPNGLIVDLTAEQFPDYRLVEAAYPFAKVTMFMQTGGPGPSKRARTLATLLGYTETQWRKP
jgi:hypothetical protein